MNLRTLNQNRKFRDLVSLCAVVFSAALQVYVIHTMIRPSSMISTGFTGVSLLVEMLTNGAISSSFVLLQAKELNASDATESVQITVLNNFFIYKFLLLYFLIFFYRIFLFLLFHQKFTPFLSPF